jgi:hypothetical protein
MSKTKNVTVKVRMTDKEKAKLKRFAWEQGVTLSDVVRYSVTKHMKGVYGI